MDRAASVWSVLRPDGSRTEKNSTKRRSYSSVAANRIRVVGLKLSLAELNQGEQWLAKLAEETGGRLFLPKSFDELGDAYQQVADELRSQYVIYYTPRDTNRDGRYRTVRVKAKCSDCRTTSRLGYFAK